MTRPAVSVVGIGKQYMIAGARRGGRPARSAPVTHDGGRPHGAEGLLGRLPGFRRKKKFWALRDVTFEVQPGEALGIVGRNGSGKSTLLKLLSRVTPPTEGHATTVGRMGSLLEIGAGFHPELTGRENTHLSGSILGMKRREIEARFDDIVDFSGVTEFIDMPVKRYSSGMYLRLAFAVAAHLNTEIMLVDEVLAVGDSAFQKSCLDKLTSLVRDGCAVLFVSHNLAAVSRLCDSAVVLDHGGVVFHGDAPSAIAQYEGLGVDQPAEHPKELSSGLAIRRLRLDQGHGGADLGTSLRFSFDLALPRDYWRVSLGFGIRTIDGYRLVFDVFDPISGDQRLGAGRHMVRIHLPELWLRSRVYIAQAKATAYPATGNVEKVLSDTLEFVVRGNDGCGLLDPILQPPVRWELEPSRNGHEGGWEST